ncbi:MAG: hypothetical protein M1587_03170 [Thaumarchaeota archaeon]|nr:hypothetical protein [Nitrososphaerota archaeon]
MLMDLWSRIIRKNMRICAVREISQVSINLFHSKCKNSLAKLATLVLLGILTAAIIGSIPSVSATSEPQYCVTLGGSWNTTSAVCTFSGSYTLSFGASLQITPGTTLLINSSSNYGINITSNAFLIVAPNSSVVVENSGNSIGILNNGSMSNYGTITIQNSGTEGIQNSGSITNECTGIITIQNSGGAGLNNKGTLTNQGKITGTVAGNSVRQVSGCSPTPIPSSTQCLEGFDFSPGGAFGQDAYAGSLCGGQIFAIPPTGSPSTWATGLGSVADIQFSQCTSGQVKMYFVNGEYGKLEEIAPGSTGGNATGLPPGYQLYVNDSGLNFPKGIAITPRGSPFGDCAVYVAESGSGYILKVGSNGVSKFAYVGSSSFPVGLTFSPGGEWGNYLYVGIATVNSTSYGIVRIAPNGTVYNFALQGTGVAPLAFDPPNYSSGLYAGQWAAGNIWKVEPNGSSTEFMAGDGTQVRYMKFAPASFGGQLVFTDYSSGNLDTVSPSGTIQVFAGTSNAPTFTPTTNPVTPPVSSTSISNKTTTTQNNLIFTLIGFGTILVVVVVVVVAIVALRRRSNSPNNVQSNPSMFCRNCGYPLEVNFAFCRNCGNRVENG